MRFVACVSWPAVRGLRFEFYYDVVTGTFIRVFVFTVDFVEIILEYIGSFTSFIMVLLLERLLECLF